MPFKVTNFGTNRKLICDFLLIINTNLPPILHRFRDTAFNRSKNRYIWLPLLRLTLLPEWFPWDDLCKIFRECQRVAKVPNGKEIFLKISTGWVGCTSITDDRQPDGRATAKKSEHGCEFTFAKNQKILLITWWMATNYFFMVTLCNRADHYIFALWFLCSSSFFLFFLV